MSELSGDRLTTVVDQLISVASPDGTGAEGLVAVSTRGGGVFGQVGANSFGIPPDVPPGPVLNAARTQLGRTLAISGPGSWTALASTGNRDYLWTKAHKNLQPDQFPDANPNGLLTVGGTRYVADAGANLIAKVDGGGHLSTLAYLQGPKGSIPDAVPT